ncbi:MAG TPA: RNA polymerase sigma factor [Tepidisphaeraceae bacterium]|nr:RNA polymerase sigma factor [Tepidisphaeraceae bacterium]
MSDDELEMVGKLKKGDSQSWRWLVDRYGNRLYGLARGIVGSSEDAEDVVQETLSGAFRSIRGFQGRASLWTWLVRILVRQASRRRAQARAVDRFDETDESSPSSTSGNKGVDARVDLDAALMKLNVEHRQILLLREMEQMTYDEISESLEIPIGTVESRLYRARLELRRSLSEWK